MENRKQLIENILHLLEKMNSLVLTYKTEDWMRLDLTIDQLKSLILIHNRGKVNFRELAMSLGITSSNITGIADRLARNGLVTRNQDKTDRRVQYLMLTVKGREILDNIRQRIASEGERILEILAEEDLAALDKGLSAVVQAGERLVFNQKIRETGDGRILVKNKTNYKYITG